MVLVQVLILKTLHLNVRLSTDLILTQYFYQRLFVKTMTLSLFLTLKLYSLTDGLYPAVPSVAPAAVLLHSVINCYPIMLSCRL